MKKLIAIAALLCTAGCYLDPCPGELACEPGNIDSACCPAGTIVCTNNSVCWSYNPGVVDGQPPADAKGGTPATPGQNSSK